MPTRLHYPRRHIPVHQRVAANDRTADAAVRCAHKPRLRHPALLRRDVAEIPKEPRRLLPQAPSLMY